MPLPRCRRRVGSVEEKLGHLLLSVREGVNPYSPILEFPYQRPFSPGLPGHTNANDPSAPYV